MSYSVQTSLSKKVGSESKALGPCRLQPFRWRPQCRFSGWASSYLQSLANVFSIRILKSLGNFLKRSRPVGSRDSLKDLTAGLTPLARLSLVPIGSCAQLCTSHRGGTEGTWLFLEGNQFEVSRNGRVCCTDKATDPPPLRAGLDKH